MASLGYFCPATVDVGDEASQATITLLVVAVENR
jgi:hypothetical protein